MYIIYVVIENGDPYPIAYNTYYQAIEAVKTKHKEEIEEELRWLEENPGQHGCNDVDVRESASGISRLYIEKGIHIEIHRLPVV
jgi:hypothetical protein